jgi:hypothetical protein
LSAPILFFVPLMRGLLPGLQPDVALRPVFVAESLAAIAVGVLLYRATHRRTLPLPRRIFHLEEATLIILVGLLLTYALLHG